MNNGIYPYVIPVNFGFEFNDDKLMLFFHGAKDGKKHEVIKQDNHTTFEIDCGHMLCRLLVMNRVQQAMLTRA